MRVLTEGFAWFGTVGLVLSLVTSGPGSLRLAVAAAAALVPVSWLWRARGDSWWLAAWEGAVLAVACLVLPEPQPAVGFLFGVTTRRAVRGGRERFPLKALPALAGYLLGTAVLLAHRQVPGSSLPTTALPLLGLVIGSLALRETTLAAQAADDARRTIGAMLHASPVGMLLLDGDGRPRLHNRRAAALLGWADDDRPEPVPCPHGPDITACAHGCARPATPDGEVEPVEVDLTRPDGDEVALTLHPAPVERSAGPARTVVAVVDTSSSKQREAALRQRSERDELTGLASRAHFLELVDTALGRRDGLALVVLDLDQFKEVNDTEGHDAGDELLASAARRIAEVVGRSGDVARLGGDEFAVLVPDRGAEGARELAERLLAALGRPSPTTGYEAVLRASAGIATAPSGTGGRTADLLRDADTAMYVAKRAGGGRIEVFHPTMADTARTRQRDKNDLRAALDRDELLLHYQPIVDLRTTRVVGAEALVRWQRPDHGLLSPARFIQLAEETGIIVSLGQQVLARACAQTARWHASGADLGVTVNVSPRQLSTPGFPEALTALLADTGIPPRRLTLEVTESVCADQAAMRALDAVRPTGVRVALDDFGTGYSSLGYLQRHPFDVIKIDRSFTQNLEDTHRTAGVVGCIIDLADVLGATVVAEGVETPAQAEWLRRAGCGYAQGYLFGKPAAIEDWPADPHAVR